METDLGKLVAERMQRARADAWLDGFWAGQRYGAQCEQYDPSRDREDERPTAPANPYE